MPLLSDEQARLDALRETAILDTPDEIEFDQVVALAAELCDVPIALITLIDEDRQWFKARKGIQTRETSRDVSICSYAIRGRSPFIVPDTRADVRFAHFPLVKQEPGVRFYAGIPFHTSDGFALGTLCVMGPQPRDLSEREQRALNVLALHVSSLLDLRRAQTNTYRLLRELRDRSTTQERITHTATRLLTVVAHDVRGPLDSIIAALDFADADFAVLRAEIKSQAVLARDLLDQILAWARTMMRGGPTVDYNVDMKHIVKEVIDGASINAARKNTTITSDVQIATCDTDPNLMRFILHTLVTNAVKFTDNGNVMVRLSRGSDSDTYEARMEVIDTGVGMTPQTLQNLFDWGRRSVNAGTHHEKGAGLALLLVKDFCDLLGWTIRIESEVGKGTSVLVSCTELPIFVPS